MGSLTMRPARGEAPSRRGRRAATRSRRRAALLAVAAVAALGPAPADAQIFRRDRGESDRQEGYERFNPGYDGRLQFVRLRFDVGSRGGFGFRRGRGQPLWMHDYPRAERNFMQILDETTFIGPVVDASNILAVDDPELFKYPVAYIVEVGAWNPSDSEVLALRAYLEKGGFLIVDDFRSNREWANFAFHWSRVMPEHSLVELDASHPIFDAFFRIGDLDDVRPPTFGQYPPMFFGAFEDDDREKRLIAIVNFNNDIAEYWEYSDRGYYPIDLSNEAYKLGVNYMIYSMTH